MIHLLDFSKLIGGASEQTNKTDKQKQTAVGGLLSRRAKIGL